MMLVLLGVKPASAATMVSVKQLPAQVYTVMPGDTVSSLAWRMLGHSNCESSIERWLAHANTSLTPGATFRARPVTITVACEEGDTWASVAAQFRGLTRPGAAKWLADANHAPENSALEIGRQLEVPPAIEASPAPSVTTAAAPAPELAATSPRSTDSITSGSPAPEEKLTEQADETLAAAAQEDEAPAVKETVTAGSPSGSFETPAAPQDASKGDWWIELDNTPVEEAAADEPSETPEQPEEERGHLETQHGAVIVQEPPVSNIMPWQPYTDAGNAAPAPKKSKKKDKGAEESAKSAAIAKAAASGKKKVKPDTETGAIETYPSSVATLTPPDDVREDEPKTTARNAEELAIAEQIVDDAVLGETRQAPVVSAYTAIAAKALAAEATHGAPAAPLTAPATQAPIHGVAAQVPPAVATGGAAPLAPVGAPAAPIPPAPAAPVGAPAAMALTPVVAASVAAPVAPVAEKPAAPAAAAPAAPVAAAPAAPAAAAPAAPVAAAPVAAPSVAAPAAPVAIASAAPAAAPVTTTSAGSESAPVAATPSNAPAAGAPAAPSAAAVEAVAPAQAPEPMQVAEKPAKKAKKSSKKKSKAVAPKTEEAPADVAAVAEEKVEAVDTEPSEGYAYSAHPGTTSSSEILEAAARARGAAPEAKTEVARSAAPRTTEIAKAVVAEAKPVVVAEAPKKAKKAKKSKKAEKSTKKDTEPSIDELVPSGDLDAGPQAIPEEALYGSAPVSAPELMPEPKPLATLAGQIEASKSRVAKMRSAIATPAPEVPEALTRQVITPMAAMTSFAPRRGTVIEVVAPSKVGGTSTAHVVTPASTTPVEPPYTLGDRFRRFIGGKKHGRPTAAVQPEGSLHTAIVAAPSFLQPATVAAKPAVEPQAPARQEHHHTADATAQPSIAPVHGAIAVSPVAARVGQVATSPAAAPVPSTRSELSRRLTEQLRARRAARAAGVQVEVGSGASAPATTAAPAPVAAMRKAILPAGSQVISTGHGTAIVEPSGAVQAVAGEATKPAARTETGSAAVRAILARRGKHVEPAVGPAHVLMEEPKTRTTAAEEPAATPTARASEPEGRIAKLASERRNARRIKGVMVPMGTAAVSATTSSIAEAAARPYRIAAPIVASRDQNIHADAGSVALEREAVRKITKQMDDLERLVSMLPTRQQLITQAALAKQAPVASEDETDPSELDSAK